MQELLQFALWRRESRAAIEFFPQKRRAKRDVNIITRVFKEGQRPAILSGRLGGAKRAPAIYKDLPKPWSGGGKIEGRKLRGF